jgi:hypothetical protein
VIVFNHGGPQVDPAFPIVVGCRNAVESNRCGQRTNRGMSRSHPSSEVGRKLKPGKTQDMHEASLA